MNLDKLTPLELHHLLYDVFEKIKEFTYVYDEKNRITHNDYFVSNIVWHYDGREEIERMNNQ